MKKIDWIATKYISLYPLNLLASLEVVKVSISFPTITNVSAESDKLLQRFHFQSKGYTNVSTPHVNHRELS